MKKILVFLTALLFHFSLSATTQGNIMTSLKLSVGQQAFQIEPADTKAAQELAGLLPLRLEMQDHLSNEKFADLPKSLSRNDHAVGNIQRGDILLWQGNTLVIFYESFRSSYSYTKLGKIRDVNGLKVALGKGNVTVRIEAE